MTTPATPQQQTTVANALATTPQQQTTVANALATQYVFNFSDKVLVWGKEPGIIRYLGTLERITDQDKERAIYIGVELENPVGNCNGFIEGKQHFECEDGYGIFVKYADLIPYSEEDWAASVIQKQWKQFIDGRAARDSSTSEINQTTDSSQTTPPCVETKQNEQTSVLSPSRKELELLSPMGTSALNVPRNRSGSSSTTSSATRALTGRKASLYRPGRTTPENSEFLWRSWQQLDWKAEAELAESYETYAKLVAEARKKRKGLDSPSSATFSSPTSKLSSSASSSTSSSSSSHSDDPHVAELPALSDPLTLAYVKDTIDYLRFGGTLPKEDVCTLLQRVTPILMQEANVVALDVTTRCTVVGDLHGQLDDLLNIFRLNGFPAARNQYVFNGDYVDRGKRSVEVFLVIVMLKLLHPKHVHLNRGNHEARDINSRDGFMEECISKYDGAAFELFQAVFACLPLGAVVDGKVFIVHGGLFWDDVTIDQLNQLNRFHQVPPKNSLLEQALWSDPVQSPGRAVSRRGAGITFGPDVVETFLRINGLELIIRSHEVKRKGYGRKHNGQILTVFSASNYGGKVGNDGAYVVLEKNQVPLIIPYYTHPPHQLTNQVQKLRKHIVTRISYRIASSRLALISFYSKVEDKDANTVTHAQWQKGLKQVLQLDIPFARFQEQLGVPLIGTDGKTRGRIDYMAFLSRFRPQNDLLRQSILKSFKSATAAKKGENPHETADAAETTNTGAATDTLAVPASESQTSEEEKQKQVSPRSEKAAQDILEQLTGLLFEHRFQLQSLFRYFDTSGAGWIHPDEFKQGLVALSSVLNYKVSDELLEASIQHLDAQQKGRIEYKQFFKHFEVPHIVELKASHHHHNHQHRVDTKASIENNPITSLSPPLVVDSPTTTAADAKADTKEC